MLEPATFQLGDDPAFQRRFWRLERIAWGVFGFVLFAALLGITGRNGPLAQARLTDGPLSITAPRVARWDAGETFELSGSAPGALAEVTLTDSFFDWFELEQVVPKPAETALAPGAVRLRFDEDGPGRVLVQARPKRPGVAEVELAAGARRHRLRVIVLP